MAEHLPDVGLAVLLHHQVAPGHEPGPGCIQIQAIVRIGNGTILGHGDQLFPTGEPVQNIKSIFLVSVIVCSGIGVMPYDVHPVIARIPVRLRCGPDPEKVVELVVYECLKP